MAVACYIAEGVTVQRSFDPPARSSLRAWYNAATKHIPNAPKYDPVFELNADITLDAIIFVGEGWNLFIARRRWLKA